VYHSKSYEQERKKLNSRRVQYGSVVYAHVQFYFHRRLDSDYSVLLKYVAEMLVCTLAAFTCLTRITDNMHHWSDVLAGVAVGLIVAVWNVKTRSSAIAVIADRTACSSTIG